MPPTPDEVRLQLDRMLATEGFASAGRMSRFLRYVVERTLAGEGDRLKEYAIGVDVFDRDGQYDPRVDSIVRVEAGRLRARVEEYYNREGRSDAVIIRLRRGTYVPGFELRDAGSSVEPSTVDSTSSNGGRWTRLVGLIATGIALALVAIGAWSSGFWGPRTSSTLTIAVLPFASYSTDEADRLLAARLTDGVTGELARLGTLAVVSHTSARQFTGARRPIKEIARALGADIVMEASVTRADTRVRVQARLVDASADRKMWVEDFAGAVDDLEELERRVAASAAAAAARRPPS